MNTTNIYINTSHIPFATPQYSPYIWHTGCISPYSIFTLLTKLQDYLSSFDIAADKKGKLTGIIIELTQNIQHYSSPEYIDNTEGIPSFKLEKKENEFVLTASNMLHQSKVAFLKNRLTELNSYSSEKLNNLYRDILKNENLVGEHAGLGLIDIYRKSGKPVLFKFTPKSNNHSLFTVTVSV